MAKYTRVLSYMGRVIWWNGDFFTIANGDGTDAYFESINEAMDEIEKRIEDRDEAKTARREER